ncbi:hypothetical protein PsorP6_012133 [Peronosclerospora sorghi]|uniref:Uncharacterized protein n=1 Tax=Peronosclerospora sorghi TaxID=230839 RepID=A0ACC0WIU7_9STRA|nr:hypothetical protein PsorP6_012133 [Peronosclerospora sorghi]
MVLLRGTLAISLATLAVFQPASVSADTCTSDEQTTIENVYSDLANSTACKDLLSDTDASSLDYCMNKDCISEISTVGSETQFSATTRKLRVLNSHETAVTSSPCAPSVTQREPISVNCTIVGYRLCRCVVQAMAVDLPNCTLNGTNERGKGTSWKSSGSMEDTSV